MAEYEPDAEKAVRKRSMSTERLQGPFGLECDKPE
jgi:hypothetical protein